MCRCPDGEHETHELVFSVLAVVDDGTGEARLYMTSDVALEFLELVRKWQELAAFVLKNPPFNFCRFLHL